MYELNNRQLLENTLRVVAILLMVSGVLVSTVPLESKRPADAERAKLSHAGRQDVEARLWQDPFTVMQRTKSETAEGRCAEAKKDAAHHPIALASSIARRAHREAVTVLPVMVQGGPYFEDGESRRRARYAVVSALLKSGWEPSDEEKLGYLWTFESCINNPRLRWAPELLPWEWFVRKPAATKPGDDGRPPAEALLVLWVDEDALSRQPIRGTQAIVKMLACGGVACLDAKLTTECIPGTEAEPNRDGRRDSALATLGRDRAVCTPKHQLPAFATSTPASKPSMHAGQPGVCFWGTESMPHQPWCATRVLGPGTSETLRGLARDLAELSPETRRDYRWLRFYASGATAAEFTILEKQQIVQKAAERNRKDAAARDLTKSELDARVTDLDRQMAEHVLRLTSRDDALANALITELKLRLIDPDPFWRLAHGGREDQALGSATMVIVSERDSLYARLFGDLFCLRAEEIAIGDHTPNEHCVAQPFRLVRKSYLRGLDGVLPEGTGAPAAAAEAPSGSASAAKGGLLAQAPRERADGRGQYDYLRRLAEDLAVVDTRERRRGRDGVRAIGVLGVDAYDRILVMEALRERFPKAVFFTADLDARMMGAEVGKWTRNLVVASAYGLTLNPGIQDSTPPFRDSYQSGLYLSTLVALDRKAQLAANSAFANWFSSPQLFEIGRTRAIALSKGATKPCSEVDPGNCSNVHNLDEWLVSPWPRLWSAAAFLLIAAAAGLMLLFLACDRARNTICQAGKRRWAVPGGGLLAGLLGYVLLRPIWQEVSSYTGEPFAWLEGVSLWPTIVLQMIMFVVIATMLWWYCVRGLSKDLNALARQLGLPSTPLNGAQDPSPPDPQLMQPIHRLWWLDYPGAEEHRQSRDVAGLWSEFSKRMCWPEQIKRIAATSTLAMIFSIALLSIDWPNSPHRGAFAAWWQHVSLLLVLLALVAILFAVLDASAMAKRFMTRLDPHMAMPWPAVRETTSDDVPALLDERLVGLHTSFRLVVGLGSTVKRLVYLPVVAFLLVLPARARIFDAWTLPLAYALLFVMATVLIVLCAVGLRRAAANFKSRVVHVLDEQLGSCELEADLPPSATTDATRSSEDKPWQRLPAQARARRIRELRDAIQTTHEGPFVPFTEDPMVQAVLLLLGGTGAITTAQFLFMPGG